MNTDSDPRVRNLVRQIGALVGDTIEANEGETAFGTVELLRRGFISLRRERGDRIGGVVKLANNLDRLSPETATTVARWPHLAGGAGALRGGDLRHFNGQSSQCGSRGRVSGSAHRPDHPNGHRFRC